MFWNQKKNDDAFDAGIREILLGEPVPIAWTADVFVDRGPVDDPMLVHAYATTSLNHGGEYTDQLVEDNAVRFVAQEMNVEAAACQVISLTWSAKSLV